MNRLLASLLLVLVVSPPLRAEIDLDAELARLVDLPYAEARREAADALAAKEDVTVADLLTAMHAFGTFEAQESGVHIESLRLGQGDEVRLARIVVYVPTGYDPAQPAPLLLALHGAGGRGAEMIPWWRATADALGMLLVAPTEAGANEGFRFSAREREDVLACLRWVRRRYNVDENRVHLTGSSRGGHLTWDLGVRHPTPWASLAPMIGGPRLHPAEGQNNLRYVENVAHLPIRDLQGREDDSRMIHNLGMAFEKLRAAQAPDAELLLQAGHGHGFDLTAVDWPAWLGAAERDPHRERVVRLSAREDEGRTAWVEVLAHQKSIQEAFALRVAPARWNALSEDGRRRAVQAEADRRTARLEVRRTGVGRYEAKGSGVKRFRLLLTQADFEPGERVEVRFNGRRYRRRVEASAAILLREFAERFDRTFLPVAEVVVP